MRTRRAATITDLRRAVDCLPRATRIAMLEGIRSNSIIVGAYTGPDGICPMLAAHRAGGRTDFIAFAKAWDRFALGGSRCRRARRATRRELLVLTTQLEASLLDGEAPVSDLAAAIAEHKALVSSARRDVQGSRPGEPDRAPELSKRPGWAWMRVMRRYDEYERALELLEQETRRIDDREPVVTSG
ncbi:MAG: hypothetical protein ACXVUL_22930 [Solirubrobacteraceae bacterium]